MPWIDLSTSSTVSVNTRKWTNMVSKAKADEVEPGPEEWGYELVGDADKPTTRKGGAQKAKTSGMRIKERTCAE